MNFTIGLSGMNAASRRIDAAAAEISRAAIPSIPQVSADQQIPIAPSAIPQAVRAAVPEPDLAGAMIEQIAASALFLANVQMIRRTDENLESLLRNT